VDPGVRPLGSKHQGVGFGVPKSVWAPVSRVVLVIAGIFILCLFLASQALGFLGLADIVHDLNSSNSSTTKSVVAALLLGQWWYYVAALAVVVLGLVWMHKEGLRHSAPPGSSLPEQGSASDEIATAERERDDALERVVALEAQLSFPKFSADFLEIRNQDPPGVPDLFVAMILQIGNDGASSVCGTFKASARTVYGKTIEVVVVSNVGFRLSVNGGRDCYNYLPEHFIMDRTRLAPVQRGVPVVGVLPCVFKGITDAKEVNWLSVEVRFCDGIGTKDGGQQWWRTPPIEESSWSEIATVRFRPGLPALESPCKWQ
jgi:hypothetical protein